MTKEQERVLAQIEANDPHPERGEIKFATDRIAGDYYERTSYKNGRLDGVSERLYERWYATGELYLQRVYKNCLLASHNSWYSNGQLSERTTFKKGREDGLYESWYTNGELQDRCMFKDGRLCNEPTKVVVPSSPVQEQAQAILNARGERNDNTLKNAQEERVERKSQSHKL